MKIILIDADLLDGKSNFPNLALMKISSYYKHKGKQVELLRSYSEHWTAETVYVSKVFDSTKVPIGRIQLRSHMIYFGGTGWGEELPDLPSEIEHSAPDYSLYKDYIEARIREGDNPKKYENYTKYSIGFLTRGCFRKCSFCVNKKYDKAFKASDPSEFVDSERKRIILLDDNFLAYPEWWQLLDEIESYGKPFQFNQGLDIRLLTNRSAIRFANAKTFGDIIFAFDSMKDSELIDKKLRLWRQFSNKSTKLYVLCGFESQDERDIESVFERIEIIARHRCIPYLMRHADYKGCQFEGLYVQLARWCNQPKFFKKTTFREFCQLRQAEMKSNRKCSAIVALEQFEELFPHIAEKWFDVKFWNNSTNRKFRTAQNKN